MGMNPASMLGAFRPIPVFDPLAQRQKKAATIVSEVNAQEAQQQQADEKAIRGALQVSGGKLDDNTISKIALVKPAAAQALIKSQHDARTSQYQASKAQLDQQKEQLAIQGTKVAQEGQFFDAILKGADRRLVIESMPGTPEEKQALMGMSEADFQKMAQAKSEMARTWKDREAQALNAATLKEKEAKLEHDKATEEYNRQLRVLTLGKAANEFEHGQVEPATGETKHETLTRTKPPAPSAAVFAATIADPAATPEQKAQAQAAMKELERHTTATQRPVSVSVNSGAGDLTEDDYKRLGAEAAITGVMPALGNGSGSTKAKILHYKQEYARQSGLSPRDLALAGSAWKGDNASRAQLQKQRDQIVSFEETAQKNIDTFLGLASKLPDTGIPWLNLPLRKLDAKLIGGANIAAVNAARNVANNEIAKVTSGGGLGGVLSDHARKEVAAYNPEEATLPQTIAIVKVLKSDMASRHRSMDDALQAIQDRMGTFGAQQAPKGGDLPKGDGKKIDSETAKRFVEAAGGDNAKARTLAKEKGWTF